MMQKIRCDGSVASVMFLYYCASALLPQEGGKSSQAGFKCVASGDPNEKAGPAGSGTLRYIRGNDPLGYAIYFENADTATAPAQTVVITGITGNLNEATGVITWIFSSLDPVTHNPTTDPLAGFLPPNLTPSEGEGRVLYIVQPNLDLPSGTRIGSFATILFDNNDPIKTNTWDNNLDRTPPVSSMQTIDTVQVSNLIKLSWTGSDYHSGIKKYILYASANGGPFIEWLSTSDTSCTFQGDSCSYYQFYILSIDNAGNKEHAKSSELQVRVNPFLNPLLKVFGVTQICEGDSVLLRADSGANLLYMWYRDNNLLQDEHDSIYYAKISGDYSVKIGMSEICSGTSGTIPVIVNSIPDAVITATNNMLETVSGEASYQWYLNSIPITGATGSTYTAAANGEYQVLVTGLNGCSQLSAIYNYLATTIEDYSSGQFRIFPNPAHDKLYVSSVNGWTEDLTIRITDVSGRIVYINKSESDKIGQTLEIDLNRIRPGVYVIQILQNKDMKQFVFTKQ